MAYAPDTSKTPNPGKSLIAADGVGRVATSNAEGGVDADVSEAILEEERRKLNYIAREYAPKILNSGAFNPTRADPVFGAGASEVKC